MQKKELSLRFSRLFRRKNRRVSNFSLKTPIAQLARRKKMWLSLAMVFAFVIVVYVVIRLEVFSVSSIEINSHSEQYVARSEIGHIAQSFLPSPIFSFQTS